MVSARPSPGALQRGFTLLEVIVALSVMALSLTAILRVFTTSTGAARVSHDYYNAVQIAQSQLALAAAGSQPARRASGEIDDYYRWSLEVDEYRSWELDTPLSADDGLEDAVPVVPYHYQVSVRWGETRERELVLSTIRLVGVAQ